MAKIYESKNFVVEAVDKPHIDRADGGHITITPKKRVVNRQQLTAKLAIELMRLTMVVGAAITAVLNNRGVDIGLINYQDNGNWGVLKHGGSHLHIHLYGRAKSAKIQKYGEALYFPNQEKHPEYYTNLKPLKGGDVRQIRIEIERSLKTPEYQGLEWGL